jgi:hypothetical protein
MQAGGDAGEIQGADDPLPDGQPQRRHLEAPVPEREGSPHERGEGQVGGGACETGDAECYDDRRAETGHVAGEIRAEQQRHAAERC